ncbi:hypothetical protein E2C01_009239 [Portunus trituberculatus]|uniref:Uncharacterized protein n=1 Tax=Portunus trituberculatus TaxID=210409 RepID=A0A5B7D5Q8_PORTR|nr:hypothetical protein [Portunus trituberculatus]
MCVELESTGFPIVTNKGTTLLYPPLASSRSFLRPAVYRRLSYATVAFINRGSNEAARNSPGVRRPLSHEVISATLHATSD